MSTISFLFFKNNRAFFLNNRTFLDVECLFTNISLEETIDNIINELFLTTDKVHNFEREELKQLTFAAYESFSIFDGEYYTSIDGVSMGSPLGPTLGDAFFMRFREKITFRMPCRIFTECLQKIC